MILLFTTNNDISSKVVTEWIDHFNYNFIRLNNGFFDIEILNDLIDQTPTLRINRSDEISVELQMNEILGVWFRGGKVILKDFFLSSVSPKDTSNLDGSLRYFLTAYSLSKIEILIEYFTQLNSLGQDGVGRINKVLALKIAQEIGLKIPKTMLCTKKSELLDFFDQEHKIVTKSLDLNYHYHSKNDGTYHQFTNIVTRLDIDQFPDQWSLTLFQSYIEKLYEVRSFYLDGHFYSMAIMSQKRDKAAIDWRKKYDNERSRVVPLKLPNFLEKKLRLLMQRLKLNTASIDLIRSPSGDFIFLEANPIGQFEFLSGMCNYYIEKTIAEYLIRDYEE